MGRSASHHKEVLGGNLQRKTGGGDERHGPDQVQIHPGFSQNVEPQLRINHEGDQPGDEKISERVDQQGDGCGPSSNRPRSGKTERVQMVNRIAEVGSRDTTAPRASRSS